MRLSRYHVDTQANLASKFGPMMRSLVLLLLCSAAFGCVFDVFGTMLGLEKEGIAWTGKQMDSHGTDSGKKRERLRNLPSPQEKIGYLAGSTERVSYVQRRGLLSL